MAEKEWTDELKAKVVQDYLAAEPTAENTMDIVKDLSEAYEKSVNGIRLVLSREGVYVKKTPDSGGKSSGTGAKRVNKQEAIDALKAAIKGHGQDVDNDICDRLTGKAAQYLTKVINAVAG